MKLISVVIENLFSYNGRQEVAFSPVTAIIGSNGLGKTSILNAIKLGLGHYDDVALDSILNNKAKKPICSITLVFDTFTINRAWNFENRIEESLTITFSDSDAKSITDAEAEHFIDNKIPAFLVDFLFYDGEVGGNLFLLSKTKLQNLFDYVFDLDLLKHVHKDSLSVAKKLLEQNNNKETEELIQLERERFSKIDKINEDEHALSLKKKAHRARALDIQKLDTQIRNKNKKIKELHHERDQKAEALFVQSQKLKELIMYQLPTLLNPDLFKALQKRSHSPLTLDDQKLFSLHFKRFLEQIGSQVSEEKAFSVFKNLLLTESTTVELPMSQKEFKSMLEIMKNLQYEIKQLDQAIETAESDITEQEQTRELIRDREGKKQELQKLEHEINDHENAIENNKSILKETEKKLTKIFKENQNAYAYIKGYEELLEVAKVAESVYRSELLDKLEVFNKTLAKNTASFLQQYKHINDIFLDDKYRIVITDGTKDLSTELLSAGQKQVLNFLIVKSILEYKEFASFVMVDTPFGRLSNANKKLLLEECYLQFDNLILLMTDSEFEFVQSQKLNHTTYHITRNALGSQIEATS